MYTKTNHAWRLGHCEQGAQLRDAREDRDGEHLAPVGGAGAGEGEAGDDGEQDAAAREELQQTQTRRGGG